jgi:hypothetical protein
MRKAELAYMHGDKSLDAAHLTTRVKNETEYAVHLGEDLKDALLRYYVDKDDSSKEQQETVPSAVENEIPRLSKCTLFSNAVSHFNYQRL